MKPSRRTFRNQNIQKIIFRSFLYTMTFLILFVTVLLSILQYSSLHDNIINDINRTCSTIGDDLDMQISQMDTICLNAINSTTVKNSFSSYVNGSSLTEYQRSQYQNEISNSLFSLRGVDSSIRQVNIYSMDNAGYGVGNYNGIISTPAIKESWYSPTVAKNGYRYVSSSQNQLFSKKVGTDDNRMYFSLYRMYFDNYHVPEGFVQVMKYYDSLFEKAISPTTSYNVTITIYDSDGNQIFPDLSSSDGNRFDYYHSLTDADSDQGFHIFNTLTQNREYAYVSHLDYSNFTVVTALRSTDFFLPIIKNLFWIPLMMIALFIFCYWLSGRISHWLGQPLTDIYAFLSDTDTDDRFQLMEVGDSGIVEIDKLRDSINASIQAKKAAADSMLIMREQELQAHMLALQAQMNPHFLYNALGTIEAMAEENMNEEITVMCQNITSILRYISSDKESVSTVEEELEHCESYLKCIKLRFQDSFTYEFDIDDELLDLKIPKLCIQLLIENSSKFVTRTAPPWHIRVEGYINDGFWLITVKDNGPGFDEEVATRLRAQMDEILETCTLPSLALDGMGILNVFIRFYLIFGKAFRFRFGNLPDRGSFVIVGGHLDEDDQTL